MARSVFIGIAAASLSLAITASVVTPSMAMSFNEYSSSARALGDRAETRDLFSGRLLSAQHRAARDEARLEDIRRDRLRMQLHPERKTPFHRPIGRPGR